MKLIELKADAPGTDPYKDKRFSHAIRYFTETEHHFWRGERGINDSKELPLVVTGKKFYKDFPRNSMGGKTVWNTVRFLKSWRDVPSRTRSIMFTNSKAHTKLFGDPYALFPANDAKIVVAKDDWHHTWKRTWPHAFDVLGSLGFEEHTGMGGVLTKIFYMLYDIASIDLPEWDDDEDDDAESVRFDIMQLQPAIKANIAGAQANMMKYKSFSVKHPVKRNSSWYDQNNELFWAITYHLKEHDNDIVAWFSDLLDFRANGFEIVNTAQALGMLKESTTPNSVREFWTEDTVFMDLPTTNKHQKIG